MRSIRQKQIILERQSRKSSLGLPICLSLRYSRQKNRFYYSCFGIQRIQKKKKSKTILKQYYRCCCEIERSQCKIINKELGAFPFYCAIKYARFYQQVVKNITAVRIKHSVGVFFFIFYDLIFMTAREQEAANKTILVSVHNKDVYNIEISDFYVGIKTLRTFIW